MLVRENLPFVVTYEAVLDALGDRTRRQIVEHLRGGPLAVGELAARMPISRPAVSQHLTVLRNSGLVQYEEHGTRNVYRLDLTGLDGLRTWIDSFWQTVLDRYAEHVRQDGAQRQAESGRAESGRAESGPSARELPDA
jgi:DNA-binding transcriptional ArsR family regulator